MPGERGITGIPGPKGDVVSCKTSQACRQRQGWYALCISVTEVVFLNRVLLEILDQRVKPELMVPG